MSTYKVGQRVRVVSTEWLGDGPSPIGMEGVINGHKKRGINTGHVHDYGVTLSNGMPIVVDSHEIEPIIPDGMKPVEWSDCLWQPEHETA